MMEKRLIFAIGVILAVFVLMVITKGSIWPFLVVGTLAGVIYFNNRF